VSDVVIVAFVTGGIALLNGPLLLAMFNKRMKNNDELCSLRKEIDNQSKTMERIAEGLTLGLENDSVIFDAFRKNSINGESEVQEQKMREYFTRCTTDAFKGGSDGIHN